MAKRRLLLADDSVTIQKVVNLTFAEEGLEVVTAGDGNAAMERFVESTPDLVMVDVNMPGLDGYRICEMIKQDDETKHIPVVLLVGSFEPFDEAEARRVGADDYLTKPFQSIRQLVSRVSDLLNRPNQNDSFNATNNLTTENKALESGGNESGVASETTNSINFESFNDVGTDDEMIQTNQIGSLPIDETQKFVSEQYFQTSENDFPDWNADEEDSGKTESANAESFEPIEINSDETEKIPQFDDKIFEFADEQPFPQQNRPDFLAQELPDDKELLEFSAVNDNKYTANNTNFNMTPQTANDSFFDFDDLDLLDIPPVAQKSFPATEQKTEVEQAPQNPPENITEEKQNSTETIETAQFSPEVIEAIAKRVVEKLSDKLIREITRDIVPQTTELILEEMARNKTN